MPTVLFVNGFRFFFYSNEGHEPAHIHVEKGGAIAKYWLKPPSLVWQRGFTKQQIRSIGNAIKQNQTLLNRAWYDYFGE